MFLFHCCTTHCPLETTLTDWLDNWSHTIKDQTKINQFNKGSKLLGSYSSWCTKLHHMWGSDTSYNVSVYNRFHATCNTCRQQLRKFVCSYYSPYTLHMCMCSHVGGCCRFELICWYCRESTRCDLWLIWESDVTTRWPGWWEDTDKDKNNGRGENGRRRQGGEETVERLKERKSPFALDGR